MVCSRLRPIYGDWLRRRMIADAAGDEKGERDIDITGVNIEIDNNSRAAKKPVSPC